MDKKDLLNKGVLQKTIINSETAIKPYYYVRNKLLHVRYTVDRAIRLSDTEESRIKQEITEFPYKKQEILETNWNFLEKNVRKSIILDGIAELSKRIKETKMDNRIKAVTFDEEKHKYFYQGVELRGVTSAIGKLLNKSFPDTDIVKLATMYGSDVHKEVENYFNDNDFTFSDKKLSTEGATWIVKELKDFSETLDYDHIECEVTVSDFFSTASKIDIVVYTKENTAYLFDIKTTSVFDRQYCSYQLSVYKELFEKNYGIKVEGLYVLSTKKKRRFHILPQDSSLVEKILEKNKNNA